MGNYLLVIKEQGIFSKIKNLIKNLFYKSSKQEITQEKVIYEEYKQVIKEDFKDEIKIKDINSLDNIITKEDLIKKIEKNKELIYELSDERLDQLIQFYEKKINKKLKIVKMY